MQSRIVTLCPCQQGLEFGRQGSVWKPSIRCLGDYPIKPYAVVTYIQTAFRRDLDIISLCKFFLNDLFGAIELIEGQTTSVRRNTFKSDYQFLKVAISVCGDVCGIYARVHIRVHQDVCMRVWR